MDKLDAAVRKALKPHNDSLRGKPPWRVVALLDEAGKRDESPYHENSADVLMTAYWAMDEYPDNIAVTIEDSTGAVVWMSKRSKRRLHLDKPTDFGPEG